MHFDLLLIEDNPGDVALTRYAVTECGLDCQLHVASAGPEAVAFLTSAHGLNVALILMDWHLPLDTGPNVLTCIRTLPTLVAVTPVVVFSSSLRPEDVRAAYNQGANCWVSKGNNLEEFAQAFAGIVRFWLQHDYVATVPRFDRPPLWLLA